MIRKISFVIVERSYIIRSGLMQILGNFPETGSITELKDTEFLTENISERKTNVLIINAKLIYAIPEVILNIREKYDRIKLVVFVGTRRENDKFPAFDTKISVDESKNSIIEKLQFLINEIIPDDKNDLSEELSDREKEVLMQVALGKTNKEIGEVLFISPHTVITHRKNITKKLGIKTVSGLTAYAILNNLIKIDEAV
ncbi:MAG: response regulator transcription factor [Bacteroidales bacterium]|nr:response regulator transcription factor [Bacteroidales bacterium]